jgi:hypothetical protein
MVEIAISFDTDKEVFKVYEPSSDTLLITSSLSESLMKLNDFLKSENLVKDDILNTADVSYHIDSYTMSTMIRSNANLLKRLSTASSGFTISTQKFGSNRSNNKFNSMATRNWNKGFGTAFTKSHKKFGGAKS